MGVGLLLEDERYDLDEQGWCDGRLGPVAVRREEVGGAEDSFAANVLGRVCYAMLQECERFFWRKLGGPEAERSEGGGGDEMVVALDEFFQEFDIGFVEGLMEPECLQKVERVVLFGSPFRQGFKDCLAWRHFAVVKF